MAKMGRYPPSGRLSWRQMQKSLSPLSIAGRSSSAAYAGAAVPMSAGHALRPGLVQAAERGSHAVDRRHAASREPARRFRQVRLPRG
ncbi:hypothetical protein IJ21_40260 [Paenibacillus sp. 32O-W]|nr:hypothetical protein IJ21_40260 [Paenibacillus sp. 32O-W]